MSTVTEHTTYINITSEMVKSQGHPYPTKQSVHQACCRACAWQGPRRSRLWEAQDDGNTHEEHPELGTQ